jgi:hypothetical protein
MTPAQSKLLIAGGALLTAVLIAFAPRNSETLVSEPSKSGKTARPAAAGALAPGAAGRSLDLELVARAERGHLAQKESDLLFARSSWVVAPPPAPPPPPPPAPPAPTAPPLPYTFMGRFEQGESDLVILTRGNRVLTATQGDVLEKTYRIDGIEANKVTLTYLPLGTTQFLLTGSAP